MLLVRLPKRGTDLAWLRCMDSSEWTRSLWKEDSLGSRPPLGASETCDVCVVGGGIAGLTTAYRLASEGKRVIVLDAHGFGGGETGQTTAHLASALDDRFTELQRLHGERGARLAYESHAHAIDEIESIAQRESIDCHFQRLTGYLFLGPEHTRKLLEDELEVAKRIGFAGVELLARAPASFETGPCLAFPRQGRFHPLRYLRGLAAAIEQRGGTLHGETLAKEVSGGTTPKVRTSAGCEVRAGAVVIATNGLFHPRIAVHSKQAPYRTYVVAFRIPKDSLPDALYWDTSDPYHYIRLEIEGADCRLIVGGEDHRSGKANDAEERYGRLERWARVRFPRVEAVTHRWSGQVLEPFDYLAFIGKDPSGERNVYIATGDSGHGMTHGTIAGILLADLMAGRTNPWSEIYDPSRKTVRAAREYVHDNVEVAAEYAEWLKPETFRPEAIAAGEGAVVQRGLHKVALYRDPQGQVHERSAVCTHLGCIVAWNSDAKSWDCACHGSRFAPTGEVLNGPAQTPLAAAPPPKTKTPRRWTRSIGVGAAGGAVATFAMSLLLFGVKRLGLLGEVPPRKIVRGLRRRAGIFALPRSADNAAALAAHWGFGMATGAVYGLLHRRRAGILPASLTGAGYGAAVWATSYYGWVPALGIMRAPHRDRPFRPASMMAGHLLFGSVLGTFVDRFAQHRPPALDKFAP